MSAFDLVKGVSNLVSLPEVCVRINSMVDDPACSIAEMGKIISLDPSLTARLLKIANSSFYSFPARIETVSRAITIIGTRELRYLILATSAVRSFGRLENSLVDINTFWRHNIYTGLLARLLASHCRVLHTERLFVAGLLHDLGHLVMYHRIPELVKVMQSRAKEANIPMYQAERDVFNVDHGQVARELFRLWNLPASLQQVAEFHHEPSKAGDCALEASIVHIANALAEGADKSSHKTVDLTSIDDAAWRITGLSREIVDPLLQEARSQFVETLLLFFPAGQKTERSS